MPPNGCFLFPTLLLLLHHHHSSLGHIIFTFPDVRYPPFDLLDSQRTIGPCGVPKSGRSQQRHFQAGKVYSLSWRMAMDGKEGEHIRLSLLDQHGELVANGVRRNANGTTADPGIPADQSQRIQSAEFLFPGECQNCTLLLEKGAMEGQQGDGILERSCAEVDIQRGELSPSDQCSGNGRQSLEDDNTSEDGGRCQCEHGFSGQYCQNRDDCAVDGDCGPGGKCVQDGVVPGQRSCFCQFGFFGTNCERRSDPDPADQHCFLHNGPSPNAASSGAGHYLYGLFNPDCYQVKELNGEDRLYWRLLGNQLELLLDFKTNSWAALGWRPLQIPPSCRLFPQIVSPEVELAKTSGFARDWLESPLHPMDCIDLVMGTVRDGSWLHIADMYSRDKSSPLKDGWLDGEESLSAAYGISSGERSILMFRRLVPEIEPTDHPLGPGPLFVIFAKGESSKAKAENGQWRYHGNGSHSRGHLQLEFVPASQMSRVRGPLIHLDSSESSTKLEKVTTTTATISSSSRETFTPTTMESTGGTGRLVKESRGIGSIWMRTRGEEEDGGNVGTTEEEEGRSGATVANNIPSEQRTKGGRGGGALLKEHQQEMNSREEGNHRKGQKDEEAMNEMEGMNRHRHDGQGKDGGHHDAEEEEEGQHPNNNHVEARESGEEANWADDEEEQSASSFSSSSMVPSCFLLQRMFSSLALPILLLNAIQRFIHG